MFEDVTFDDDCYAIHSTPADGRDEELFLFPRDGENGMEWDGMAMK